MVVCLSCLGATYYGEPMDGKFINGERERERERERKKD